MDIIKNITMNKFTGLALLFILGFVIDADSQIFNDRELISLPSVEMLDKHELDFRVSHRFGDIAGSGGGWQTFYGLETAADIKIGIQYGLGKFLNIGLNRAKGVGALKSLVNGEAKLRIFDQFGEKERPVSVVLYGELGVSTMKRTESVGSLSNFETFNHRMMAGGMIMIARKFGNRFALQIHGGVSHRNLAYTGDPHDVIHAGGTAKIQVSKVVAILLEGDYPFVDGETVLPIEPNMGIGIELFTGGHTFMIKVTNGRALSLNDQVFNTRTSWEDGEFRLGFTISRVFKK